ncbi:BKACE family enzyme [Mesorhizobium sp. NZP2298]|uniref:3-keto-5-aminohexanoate cleavage protein n=1 Tax=Mesorhizobium sp. NZP2298 TaxID=2483403 RepID=UPI0015530140|nr:3-keto-5-aminohexanoate cleavage protein [Mesorhizobium sp. NZP2298]QKC97407.1 3-keto-5-aminohexanoate cleavage protein [Mesorhizobium sp. NZP2298]
MARPVIITCALTGDSNTPAKSPHVPVTPAAIAADALAAAEAGAAIVHIHVRDPATGKGSRNTDYYREVVERIADSGADVIVNLTAGMGGKLVLDDVNALPFDGSTDLVGAAERLVHIEALKPDICSLDCGSFNNGLDTEVYVSTSGMVREMAERIATAGVKPELEVFDFGHLRLACSLAEEGLIKGPAFFQFALGLRWGAPSDAATMLLMRNMLPKDAVWVAFGAGAEQMSVAAQSILLGGHVRVGLEDNIYRSRGVLATNAQLVEDAVHLVKSLGGEPANTTQVRRILGLKQSSVGQGGLGAVVGA